MFRYYTKAATLISVLMAFPIAHADESITPLITQVRSVFSRLGMPLDLTSQEIALIDSQSRQLTDPQTGRAYQTLKGHPLPYFLIGPELNTPEGSGNEEPSQVVPTVLFIGGIHAEEIGPMYSAWQALRALLTDPTIVKPGTRVVYIPLTNPDGLISHTGQYGWSSRENARGVDLNRNFGSHMTEAETRFATDLIDTFHPSYIVSLHGPYGWLDYDGPAKLPQPDPLKVKEADSWLTTIQRLALTNLPIQKDFQTYPGSLGEYAGTTLGIHTLTFEFPSNSPSSGIWEWRVLGPALIGALRPF